MKLKVLTRSGEIIHGKGYFQPGEVVDLPDEDALQRLEDYPHAYERVDEVIVVPAPKPILPVIKKDED